MKFCGFAYGRLERLVFLLCQLLGEKGEVSDGRGFLASKFETLASKFEVHPGQSRGSQPV